MQRNLTAALVFAVAALWLGLGLISAGYRAEFDLTGLFRMDSQTQITVLAQAVDKGILTTWLLDLRSSRQLGLKTTGHAARGTASPPSPAATNVWIEPGTLSPEELIAGIESGFYVTEMMGMGVNGVTGDYSRGAAGFWIEKGEIAFPVSEMTVAGNLKEIFARLVAADDLEFKTGADSPTLRVDDLTVAGA